jgi:hypothetical protein
MKRHVVVAALVTILFLISLACTLLAPTADPGSSATVESLVQSTVASMQETLQGDQAATQAALRVTEIALETRAAQELAEITSVPATQVPGIEGQTPTEAAVTTGTITGDLSYPSEFIPALSVVAFKVDDDQWFYIQTEVNQLTYTLEGLPPGTYHVVAYPQPSSGIPSDLAAGYTQMIPCGLSVECTDHTLIPVEVNAGVTETGIDPGDWFAGPNAFPANPLVR